MKLQKLLLMISVSYSLSACADGPKIEVCISDPVNDEFSCYNAITNESRRINFTETENYVCVSPADELTLLNYCKKQKGK